MCEANLVHTILSQFAAADSATSTCPLLLGLLLDFAKRCIHTVLGSRSCNSFFLLAMILYYSVRGNIMGILV